jgi:hypothetical protein
MLLYVTVVLCTGLLFTSLFKFKTITLTFLLGNPWWTIFVRRCNMVEAVVPQRPLHWLPQPSLLTLT